MLKRQPAVGSEAAPHEVDVTMYLRCFGNNSEQSHEMLKSFLTNTYQAGPAFSIQAVYEAFGKVGDCQKLELTAPSSSL